MNLSNLNRSITRVHIHEDETGRCCEDKAPLWLVASGDLPASLLDHHLKTQSNTLENIPTPTELQLNFEDPPVDPWERHSAVTSPFPCRGG